MAHHDKFVHHVEAQDDRAYWQELAELLGWQLAGYSQRRAAFYHTRNHETLHLVASQRDDIVQAIHLKGSHARNEVP